MPQIPRTVTCPYPGFETFSVTYNMMATVKQIEATAASMGTGPELDRSAVIMEQHGWPETEYPGGPFGENAPMAVLVWTLRTGFGKAVAEYVNDPFSQTA